MRSFFKLIGCFSVLLVAQTVYAQGVDGCPPINIVRNAHFTTVSNFMDRNHWVLTTDAYTFDHKTWNTNYLFKGSYATDEEALEEGQKIFNAHVTIIQPNFEEDSGKIVCIYTDSDEFAVYAATPPYPS